MTESIWPFKGMKKNILLYGILLFVFFGCYYVYLLQQHIGTDVQEHALVSYRFVNEHGPATPNFLYFILVALLSGFSKYKMLYYAASVVLIAAAISIKFLFNYKYGNLAAGENNLSQGRLLWLSVAMLFVFCLPGVDFFETKNFLLGQLAPNIWHNSTTIFLLPFVLPLFFESYALLQQGTVVNRQRIIFILLLLVINAFIKPSFLFILLPSVFVWLVFFKGTLSVKTKVAILALYAAGLVAVAAQYIVIYSRTNEDCANCASSVILSPFTVWNHYSVSKIFSFISSFLFPLGFIVLAKGRILKDGLVKFACINWFFGVLIYILFTETGEREFHGNFSWQMVIGNYLFFYVLAAKLFSGAAKEWLSTAATKIAYALFGAHLLWGFVYFIKIALFKHYA